jgi:hypothetical protein
VRKRTLSTVTACAVLLGVAGAGPAAAAGSAHPVPHIKPTAAPAHAAIAPAATTSTRTPSTVTAASASVTVSAFGGMAVDATLHRVFVGDSATGSVTAADYNGNSVGVITGISGVSGLAVSTDGMTLYAASPGTHEVVALDPNTLMVKARYAVATTVGPTHLAFTSGKLWFTYGDQWSSNLGSVDPSVDPSGGASAVTLALMPATKPFGFNGPALTSTQPSEPGVLALADDSMSTDSMAVLDVSGGTPQLTAWYWGDYTLNSGIHDLSLVPGDAAVLVNGSLVDAYANGKFTHVASYPNAELGSASPDGYVASAWGSTVSVFKGGAQTPLRTYAAGSNYQAGLAWAPDDSRLFVMEASYSETGTGSTFSLHVLNDPTKVLPTLTASVPASGTRGRAYTVSGRLTSPLAIPAGTQLSVTRLDQAHPAGYLTGIKPVVAANGTWHFTDSSGIGGPVTYRVGYAGDSLRSAVTASATINIARSATALSISTNSTGYGYNGWAHITAHLGRTWNGRTVEIDAMPVYMPQTVVARGKVDRYGNFSAWYRVTRNTRFNAWFGGDYFYGTAWAGEWVNGYAAIADTLVNSYGSSWYAGHKFQLFHKSKLPLMGTAVGPNKGNQYINVYAQWYYSGSWHNLSPQTFALGSNGVSWLQLDFTGFPSGSHFRIAPQYGGDGINAPTWGNWLYFSITG